MIRELKLWLLAALLISAGVGILFGVDEKLHLRPLADALILAGLLAVTVDRYIKLKLRDDIAHDVFFAALGIHVPEELKDEILAIGDCKLVRRDMNVFYKVTTHTDPNFVCCETETEFDVDNLTAHTQQFEHHVWVGRSPAGVADPKEPITFVKATVSGGGYDLGADDIKLEQRDHERGWYSTVKIPPKARAHFWSTTQQILPSRFEDIYLLLQPTIGVRVRVECPPGMEPTVTFDHRLSAEAERLPRNTWRFAAAFLPHSSFRIAWKNAVVVGQAIDIGPRLQVKGVPPAPAVVPLQDRR